MSARLFIELEQMIIGRLYILYRYSEKDARALVEKHQQHIDAQVSGGNYDVKELVGLLLSLEQEEPSSRVGKV